MAAAASATTFLSKGGREKDGTIQMFLILLFFPDGNKWLPELCSPQLAFGYISYKIYEYFSWEISRKMKVGVVLVAKKQLKGALTWPAFWKEQLQETLKIIQALESSKLVQMQAPLLT